MPEYVVLFYTHSGAIKFDRKAKKKGCRAELMPVPRKLSSNCGVSAKIQLDGSIHELIDDEIEKIYLICEKEYQLTYSHE
ncbi:DUF3343 domain-containing protein [Tindallia californiensis]|uniref:Putative Se/S carrier protein-like domain-containing protein n=1 Tax=Tindallia californiensis TaxID=159292 RepID=A0A1H3Q7R1_9FIRM|nr:DUF3343 domain-containing protein [Tindallia californiensis]SDZ08739.1 Protein of unknown function [Tindallia californiensis]